MNVVFIINDPYTNNISSLYRELVNDSNCNVTVIATERLGYSFAPPSSAAEISSVLTDDNINHIVDDGSLNIASFKPDYIFTSNPYDIYLREELRSDRLSAIGRLVNISYGAALVNWDGDYQYLADNSYYKAAYKVFVESPFIYKDHTNFEPVGYTKLDSYAYYKRPIKKFDRKSIAWKPRWVTQENADFIEKAQLLLDFIDENNAILNFIIHPFLLHAMEEQGEDNEMLSVLRRLRESKHVRFVDGPHFLDDLLGSDVFISDISSTLAEFTITGKPIIYTQKNVSLNQVGEAIIACCYKAHSKQEIRACLDNLFAGIDPFMTRRQGLYNDLFNGSEEEAVSIRIKKILESGMQTPRVRRKLFGLF